MNGHPTTGEDNAPIYRLAPLPSLHLSHLDLLLVSHLHSDHFDQAAREKLPRDLPLIAPADQLFFPQLETFATRKGLRWWEETVLEKNAETLRIIALPACHSHDPVTNDNLGVVNGYALQYTKGSYRYTTYWTGDTLCFEGIQQIKERLGVIDLLVPHMGAVGKHGPWGLMTLDSEDAARVVDIIQPKTIIPIHFHTFSHYTESIGLLQEKLRAWPGQLRVLKEGETLALEKEPFAVPL